MFDNLHAILLLGNVEFGTKEDDTVYLMNDDEALTEVSVS